MWLLRAAGGPPIALNHKISEGVAISRKTNRISWSNTHGQYPDLIPEGESVLYMADIVEEGGQPKLANKVELLRAKRPECTLEAQDFRFDDTELIYTCYRSPYADVFGLDLKTKAITTFRKIEKEYNEVEGIFPDGKSTLVESSREQKAQDSNHIDIWRMPLVPNATEYTRVTYWGEYEGYKASNPVVSPDGKTIAFQSARSKDPAGVGYGIYLMKVQ
jgi:Tol biopolymer transport system component